MSCAVVVYRRFLPKKAILYAGDFFGMNVTMATFKGRQKKD